MIDCDITENYLNERKRMIFEEALTTTYSELEPQKAIAIVQAWSDAHPAKTYLTDFLEKYPNAPLEYDGTPKPCAENLGYKRLKNCDNNCCIVCWNTPLQENTK